jgi:hypothetical protein
MAGKDIRTGNDPDLIKGLVDSGSLGKGFRDIGNENTASLGLKTPAAQISSSLSEVLDENNITSPLQTSLQYVVAKTFETRDNTSLSFFSGSQAFATSRANKDTILEQQNSINSISVVTASYAAASASLSNRVTANDAKVSTGADLAPGTDGGVLKATVEENRGVYTLLFTFTTSDGRITKTVKTTMS